MQDLQMSAKKVGRPEAISRRGLVMLLEIWRYGSLGTKALHRLVAPTESAYGVSKELIKLEAKGFVTGERTGLSFSYFWTLTPAGFLQLEPFLIEKMGLPEVRVNRSIQDHGPNIRDRWYFANREALTAGQVLLAMCPEENPVAVTRREMRTSRARQLHPWMPRLGEHLPLALVMWPGKKRPKVFAVEILPTDASFRVKERIAKAYRGMKVDKIFLLLENRIGDSSNTAHAFERALSNSGWKDFSKWQTVDHLGFHSGAEATVLDASSKKRSLLWQALGVDQPSEPAKKNLADLVFDLNAKPKVWGRAYQR